MGCFVLYTIFKHVGTNRTVKIMKNIRAEFHRLTMPSKMQVLKDTVFVIAAALISSALIGAIDFGMASLIRIII